MGNSASSSSFPPLESVASCETTRLMGTWFVVGVKPTPFETTCSNAIEKYTLLDEGSNKHDIDIDFTYNPKEDPLDAKNKVKSIAQKAWIEGPNRKNSGNWKISPLWPVKMPFPIIELDEKDYSYAVVGNPGRSYCWILSRKPVLEEKLYKDIERKLVENHQYDLNGFRKVPQKWTSEERTKRGLTKEELPDSFLLN